MSTRDRDELWRCYQATKDLETRAALIEEYIGLVYNVAQKIARRLPNGIKIDELVSAGSIGLMRAIDGYNGELGFSFATYAVPRIRGAILDDLRARDHASRSSRKREREIVQAQDVLRQQLGREPTDAEVANFLGIEMERYWLWRHDIVVREHVSLEHRVTSNDGEDALSYQDIVSDDSAEDPDDRLETEAINRMLRQAISELSHQERLVLALYYYEDLKLSEIGKLLDLTESRISQIRSKALRSLRSRLAPAFSA